MNILFICDEYPPGRNGGIGTMVRVLGRELVKQGHKVHVAGLYGYRYGGKDQEVDKGVNVWRLRYGVNLGPNENNRVYNLLEKLPDFIKQSLNGKKAFDRFITFIRALIQRENIDVIEIADWNMFSFYIGFPIRWPSFSAPLIVKSHGSYTFFAHEAGEKINVKFNTVDKLLFDRADALSAVSDYAAKKNTTLFNLSSPVKILYNGIEMAPSALPQIRRPQTIIFTGTLVKKKGIFQLAKAWNLVNKKFPEAELHIYGKGKQEPFSSLLNSQSKTKVYFKGHVTREELFSQLAGATMAIFPSYSETFGLGVVEAMSVGCPVIYTKRTAGPEIITHMEDGLLIEPDYVEEIADMIILLIEDEGLRRLFSERGRKKVLEKFLIEKSVLEHIEYYARITNEFRLKQV